MVSYPAGAAGKILQSTLHMSVVNGMPRKSSAASLRPAEMVSSSW